MAEVVAMIASASSLLLSAIDWFAARSFAILQDFTQACRPASSVNPDSARLCQEHPRAVVIAIRVVCFGRLAA